MATSKLPTYKWSKYSSGHSKDGNKTSSSSRKAERSQAANQVLAVCTWRELESLAGHLCHACKGVRPGRRFLRGIFQLISRFSKSHFKICLNSEFRAGLEWWHSFIMEWNGVSTLYKHTNSKYGVMRLVLGDVLQSTTNSGFKSVGLIIQRFQWLRSTVWFHCDNQAVVDVIWGGYCKDKYLAHMLRSMFFLEAHFAFAATARHIPGIENTQADALSCNNHPEFAALVPQACSTPSKMP